MVTGFVASSLQECVQTQNLERRTLDRMPKSHALRICNYVTIKECSRRRPTTALQTLCANVRLRQVIKAYTDVHLGDCSFLQLCPRRRTCPKIHDAPLLEIVREETNSQTLVKHAQTPASANLKCDQQQLPQWINCDVRTLDFTGLGKFDVIMADPPWEVSMLVGAWGVLGPYHGT
jgi:mRNA (2'-O-methyladenosine-N6-)-methyltransferase